MLKIFPEETMEQQLSAMQIYRAALNNELMRLIWAGYKEGYISLSDDIFFIARNSDGKQETIQSWREAQNFLYSPGIKHSLALSANVHGQEIVLESSIALLNQLQPFLLKSYPEITFSTERWEHWLKVSENSVENEALAIADKMRLDSVVSRHGSVIDYAFTLGANESFIFFNRYAAYFGRYDMPFAKMKLPSENTQALAYAPEFGHSVPVILAALNRKCAVINSAASGDINGIIEEAFPEAYAQWTARLQGRRKNPLDYAVLPIHPLTLELYQCYQEALIESGDLLIDPDICVPTRAGLSYRTMIPEQAGSAIVIKLPVPLQLTGSIRHIESVELNVAPQLSDILAAIFEREKNFSDRIRLDKEVVTISVAPEAAGAGEADVRYFSCLLRENHSRVFSSKTICMPLAALFSGSGDTDRPVLVDLMERANVTTSEQAIDYFQKYLDMILGSVLSMYLRHGIILEAHQQNLSLSVNENGQIEMLHYQDVGYAVLIYRPIYAQADNPQEIFSSLSFPYLSEQFEPSAAQFVHTTLLLNLLPVAGIISRHFETSEDALLELMVAHIDALLKIEAERAASHSGNAPLFLNFYADFRRYVLESPTWRVKKLLGRMFKQSQTEKWGKIPNNAPDFLAAKVTGVSVENPFHTFIIPQHNV